MEVANKVTEGSWLKLMRARKIREELGSNFKGFLRGDLLLVPLAKSINVERTCVTFTIASLPLNNRDLGAVIGDVIHNYRSCLDYLWWQLAITNLGREPDEKEAKVVQFPILEKEELWVQAKRNFFTYIDMGGCEFIKKYQPFNFDRANGYHPLTALNELSNHDKHRCMTPVLALANKIEFPGLDMQVVVHPLDIPDGAGVGVDVLRLEGDFFMKPVAAIPDPEFYLYIAVQNGWNIFELLNGIDEVCQSILETADAEYQ